MSLWNDPWLPRDGAFEVTSRCPGIGGPIRVSDLINSSSRTWNLSLLSRHFDKEEQLLIQSIPIGNALENDNRIWHYTYQGYYTVKSAYNLLRLNQDDLDIASTSNNLLHDKSFWKSVWNLEATPKVKNFLWRAIHDSLPTMENLTRRHRAHSNLCSRCTDKVETVEHVLFFCPFAEKVWFTSIFGFKPNATGFTSFNQWWDKIFSMLTVDNLQHQIATIAQLCHSIWRARNEWVWEASKIAPDQVCKRAYDGGMPMENTQAIHTRTETNSWCRPGDGVIKMNCSSSFDKSSGTAGIAMVARNHYGDIMDCRAQFKKDLTPRAAEASAIRMAMATGIRFGWNHISYPLPSSIFSKGKKVL